jgi:hypothetical protein
MRGPRRGRRKIAAEATPSVRETAAASTGSAGAKLVLLGADTR